MGVTLTTSAYVINNRFSTTPCDVKIACGKYSTIGYGYFVMQSNTISDGCGGYYEVGSEVNENLTTGYTNGVEYIKLLHVQSGSQNIWISQTTEELIELCKCTPTNFTVVEDNGDGTYTAYMPDGTSVTWTGSTGTSFTGIVNDFASLPAANLHTYELWYVINTSAGSIGGTYYSTGTAWITPLTLFDTRISNLENNELKITYYAIVSGASGTITPPTGATFNSDEFGNSGNSILSKINGANKPTFESPKTSGGVVVTANLNTTTGAWVASGTYTDTNVALIYSINIKEKDYSNLNNFYIIDETKLNGGSSDIVIDTTPITGGASGRILFESATGKVTDLDALRWDLTYNYVHIKQTGTVPGGIVVQNTVDPNSYTQLTHQSNGYGKLYCSEQMGIQSYGTMSLIAGGSVAADININNDRLVVKWNRNVGVDLTSPSAALHIKAGTTSLAPLKINAGSVLTTPESGAIESDGTHLYWTDAGGTRRQLD